MLREQRAARPDFIERVERLGLTFHTLDGKPYWYEEAAYRFEADEIAVIEAAGNELHEMCLHAVDRVILNGEFARFGIPEFAWQPIIRTWEDDVPSLYGRFDFMYDGVSPPKLLEYNADTPTSLLEAAVIQWHWLCDVLPKADQFNWIWEALIEKWRTLGPGNMRRVHFTCVDWPEDLMTTAVLMDTAQEAGMEVFHLFIEEIGWDHDRHVFVDKDLREIEALFKLYPWEWLLREEFAPEAIESMGKLNWMEPIWKMILSNKAILAVLWEMYPDHPNLLPAYQDGPREMQSYVRKPVLGREGSNVFLKQGEGVIETDGPYAEFGWVYQELAEPVELDGVFPILGVWVVDGEACGMGVRESDGPITTDSARFVPHYFWPATRELPAQ